MELSKGERVTLIKSILSNLTTHFMSLFPIPVGVANFLKKLQRDFFNEGGMGEEFIFHLVSRTKVCTPISEGWGFKIYLCSTRLFWGIGFGAMFMRERGLMEGGCEF